MGIIIIAVIIFIIYNAYKNATSNKGAQEDKRSYKEDSATMQQGGRQQTAPGRQQGQSTMWPKGVEEQRRLRESFEAQQRQSAAKEQMRQEQRKQELRERYGTAEQRTARQTQAGEVSNRAPDSAIAPPQQREKEDDGYYIEPRCVLETTFAAQESHTQVVKDYCSMYDDTEKSSDYTAAKIEEKSVSFNPRTVMRKRNLPNRIRLSK